MTALDVPDLGLYFEWRRRGTSHVLSVQRRDGSRTRAGAAICIFGSGAIASIDEATLLWKALDREMGRGGRSGALLRLGSRGGDCRVVRAGEWAREFPSAVELQRYVEEAGEYGSWWPVTFEQLQRLARSAQFSGTSLEILLFQDRTGRRPYRWTRQTDAAMKDWIEERARMPSRPITQMCVVGRLDAIDVFSPMLAKQLLKDWTSAARANSAPARATVALVVDLSGDLSKALVQVLGDVCDVEWIGERRGMGAINLEKVNSHGREFLIFNTPLELSTNIEYKDPTLQLAVQATIADSDRNASRTAPQSS